MRGIRGTIEGMRSAEKYWVEMLNGREDWACLVSVIKKSKNKIDSKSVWFQGVNRI